MRTVERTRSLFIPHFSSPMARLVEARLCFCLALLAPTAALRVAPSVAPRAAAPRLPRAAAPRQSLVLPACGAAGVLPLAAKAGAVGALAQLGLVGLFRFSSDPVLKQAPGYTAHQIVSFALMVFVSAFGLAGWLNPPAAAATAAEG